ncbi:hypothetical protein Tco_0114962 [Tanacetum coccineum]
MGVFTFMSKSSGGAWTAKQLNGDLKGSELNMSQAIPQAAIVSEEELVPIHNRLKITKNNQRITSDSNIADSFVTLMPLNSPNKPYTKPPQENELLTFIKTLGYDEDLKQKLTIVSQFIATRLHQPWRAILSVLNQCLTGKDTSFDRARVLVLQILYQQNDKSNEANKVTLSSLHKTHHRPYVVHKQNLARRSDAFMHSEEQDSLLSKLINSVDGVLKFGKDLPDSMINDTIKQSVGYRVYKSNKEQSEKDIDQVNLEEKNVSTIGRGRGKRYMCSSSTVQSLLDLKKGYKASRLESMRQEMQAGRGEWSSVAQDDEYEYFLDTDSDVTLIFSWSSDDDKSDAEDSNMDIDDEDFDKGYDTTDYTMLLNDQHKNELTDLMCRPVYTEAQTTFVVANLEGNLKVTSFLSGTYEVPFGTNVDVQATKFVLQELFKDAADLKMSSPPATTTHNFTTNPQQILIQAKAKKLVAKAKHNKLSSNFKKATMQKF